MNIGSSKKCPLCKKSVKLVNGRYACEKCGYVINESSASVSMNTAQSSYTTQSTYTPQQTYTARTTNASQTTNNVNANVKSNYKPNYNPYSAGANGASGASGGGKLKLVTVVTTMIVISMLGTIFSMVRGLSDAHDEEYEYAYDYAVEDEVYYDYEDDELKDILNNSNIDEMYKDSFDTEDVYDDVIEDIYNDYDNENRNLPASPAFRNLVEEMFGKTYENVSDEEYASVTYLHVYVYEDRIDYAINDGEIKEFYYDSSSYTYIDKDIRCFPGLKTLNVENDDFYVDDALTGLTELTDIKCGNSLEKLVTWIENPEKIESMALVDTYYMKSLTGIENFPNITKLSVNGSYLESLEGLDALTKLKELELNGVYSVSNYTELKKLTDLEKLYIESNKIKNLTFMSDLTKLKELVIEGTYITDASVLSNCASTLTTLKLIDNYDLDDVSVINSLTKLEELELHCNYETELPDFSKLTSLKKLYLNGANDIQSLSTATSLTELTLDSCDLENIKALSSLTSLKYLKIGATYSYTRFENFTDCMPMNSLEVLDLSGVRVSNNIECIFDLPNIKEIYLQESSIGIDVSKVNGNSNLEVLNLNNATMEKYTLVESQYYDYYDFEEISDEDKATMLGKFTGLKELYMADMGISDINFVSGFSNLEKIDITNNNVLALKPLSGLSKLNTIWCAGNTISDADTLSENVELIFEENY